jgi:hypothetical protein
MVAVSIAQQLLNPPTIFTQLEHVAGAPFGAGLHLIDRVRGPIGVDAFGFAWLFTGTPAGVGQTVQAVTTFEQPLAQVLEVKQDITAATLNGRVLDLDQDEGRSYFSEFPLLRLSVYVLPATTLDLWWILIF